MPLIQTSPVGEFSGATSGSVNFGAAVGAGRQVILCVASTLFPPTWSTITAGGSTLAQRVIGDNNADAGVAIFDNLSVAGGSTLVSVSATASGHFVFCAVERDDVTAIDRTQGSFESSVTSHTVTASAANTGANRFVIAVDRAQNSGVGIAGPTTGYTNLFTEDQIGSGFMSAAAGWKTVSAIETSSATFTTTSTQPHLSALATYALVVDTGFPSSTGDEPAVAASRPAAIDADESGQMPVALRQDEIIGSACCEDIVPLLRLGVHDDGPAPPAPAELVVVELDGEAVASATLAGDLSVGKALAGGATATATMVGDLRVGLALAGSASATATLAGDLRVGKPLAAGATATATAAGDVRVGKPLAGTATATAALAGDITTDTTRLLAGTATATATLTGDLRVGKPLAAGATATATAAGDAAVGKPLAGTATATATMAGDLRVGKPLAGTALVSATLSGNLVVPEAPPYIPEGAGGPGGGVRIPGLPRERQAPERTELVDDGQVPETTARLPVGVDPDNPMSARFRAIVRDDEDVVAALVALIAADLLED